MIPQRTLSLKCRPIHVHMYAYRGESRGRVQGVRNPPPPSPEMTSGFLIQLAFCQKNTMWFIGVEVEQETSAPPPKKKILDPSLA